MNKRQKMEFKRQFVLVVFLILLIFAFIVFLGPLLQNTLSSVSSSISDLHEQTETGTSENTQNTISTPTGTAEDSWLTVNLASYSLSGATGVVSIQEFDGESPWVVIHDNEPFFASEDITTDSYYTFSELDELGRVGQAVGCIGKDIMPLGEERGDISSVKPTGWVQAKYDNVEQSWLYNRCHIIGWQLCGENAEKRNLMTGTRYFNVQGMLPFENMVADYVRETNEHTMYRVTPIFDGDNLLANGIIMEGYSVEDEGETVSFCVFVYNVQPDIVLDYATGESWQEDLPAAA